MHRKDGGSESAWLEQLYREHGLGVYKVARNRLSAAGLSADLADDVVQEVFLLALKSAEELSVHPNARAWLFKTAYLLIQNHKRVEYTRRKRTAFSMDEPDSQDIEDGDFEKCLDDVLDGPVDLKDIMHRVKQQISSQELELYEQFYVRQIRVNELSRRYGVSDNAVRIRLTRLTQKMTKIVRKIVG